MKFGSLVSLAIAALTLAGTAEAAEDLALRRVLLSSGGVGYFEYETEVEGDADIPLDVRIDQIDDILKSVVVFDDAGRFGEVVLPGKDALVEVFRDLPFDQSALDSAASLVDALRGAEVRVETPTGTFEGRISSVTTETVALPEGGTTTGHRLTVLSNGTMRQVMLEDVSALTFLDPTLQMQIDEALQALLAQHETGKRELMIHVDGEGVRRVRVAYVVEVPLWKATYRLTLPRDPQIHTGDLQGFAIVENRSGEDWKDIELTVAAGNPVTFHQALYDAYYVDRPEVPVDVVNHVLPRLDEGAIAIEARASAHAAALAADDGALGEAEVQAAEAMQSMTQVEYRLPAVSVADGETAEIGVISATIPAERVSIYEPEIATRNPLASVQITNDTGADLPPGAITVYERAGESGPVSYLGDARIAPLPVGEKAIATFAVDLKVTIDRETESERVLSVATIADGVLTITREQRQTTIYTIQGAALEPRTVILEQPKVAGFSTIEVEGGQVIGQTETHYRVRVEVAAGQTVEVKVTLSRPLAEIRQIADLSRDQVLAYASSSELPEAIRTAMAHVAELQAALAERQAELSALNAELARITADQARIRENLKVVPAGSDLADRYLATLGEQETRIEELRVAITAAETAVADARAALAAFIRGLSTPSSP